MSLPPINGDRTIAPRRTPSQQSQKRHVSPAPASYDDNGVANSSSTSTATANVAATTDRRDAADFRIVVAARIRPFTEREVRRWRQERRVGESAEDAEEARRVRAAQRQPFGPGHKALNVTTQNGGLDGTWSKRNDDNDGGGVHRSSLDSSEVPLPVVEVESDGKTVVLLDAQSVTSGGVHTTAPVRSAFTYDYVYSSFAPNVELDTQFTENGAGRRGDRSAYVIQDADDEDAENNVSGHGRSGASSHSPAQEQQAEAEQVAIYEQLAIPLVSAAMHGYNTCMFAYGQTGSGKTYTMMGTARHPGLIPRLCQLLFAEVAARNSNDDGTASSAAPATLQLSYMEIYNEQVRDLLKQRPKNAILRYKSRFDKKDVDSDEYRTLKVRHHPSKGIYVDGLTSVPAGNWAECEAYLQQGNALRTQCSTAMNAKSSRSHAIFQLQMTQRERTGGRVRGRDVALESFSKVNLVDLAGSERNAQSKTTGKHLAEANSINASLSTLRRVLDGLIANRNAAHSGVAGAGKSKKGAVVIPYRESLLTYVLSDNLGGNSFTVMCANVSPCAANAGETESTLRYATLAKSVVNHAKLNEAPTARVIREMRDQMRVMQEALRSAPDPSHVAELEEGVQLSEELLRTMRSREGDYEAQLQAQAAQADALRHAVEAHKQQESFWREEAQRQQREVEDLREALLEATQHSTRGGRGGASAPLHLPSLGVMQSPFTSDLGADGDDDDAGAAKAAKAPSGKKKRTSTTTATTGATPPSGKMEEVLLSPASRDWKPARARGTPLSLMGGGGRSKQRPSRPSLPTLPEGPSSAPEKSRRASRTSVGAPTTAPPSGQPRSTTTSKQQQQQQSPPLAPRPPPSTKATHVAGRRGDGEKEGSVEAPSFYQTEEYLVPHTDEAPSSSRLDFSHLDADVSALMAGYAEGPAVPSRESHPPDLHSALDVQQLLLQAQAEDAALRHGGGAWDGGLEIEGVAATPSKQAPAHSTRVAVARKAQAERDRRRSSCTAATATTATKKKLKKKKVVKANPAGDDESREGASVARDGAWTPEANSMSVEYAQAAEVIEMSERGGDGRPSLKSGDDHDDDDDDGVEYITSGASRSPHGDDGLTNMHSANADYRNGEDDRAHGHALATGGDLHQATAAAAAASMHAHRSNASDASGDEGDRLWGLNDEAGDEELYADDMESAAASLNRSAKAANVAPPLTKKKKSKSNGGRRANADSSVGSRHYSTVDTLH